MASLPPGVEIRGERASSSPSPTSSRGRGLYATRSFEPGEAIAVFGEPLVLLSASRQALYVCNYCLDGRRQPVKACTGCRAVAYCGSSCQRAHWRSVHRLECRAMQAALATAPAEAAAAVGTQPPPPRTLPTPVRALLQLLLQWPAVRAAVDGLEGNVAGFRQHAPRSALWDDLVMEAMAACSFAGWTGTTGPTAEGTMVSTPSPEQLDAAVQILCKIHTNTFDRSDADVFPEVGGQTGMFLDTTLAMVNHSCVPTAVVAFAGRRAHLRAEQAIREGDEITISYIDYTKPQSARQRALALYHFTCTCRRCADDLDVYQVCRTSPLLPLNTTRASFVPDVDVLRSQPPAGAVITAAQIDAIYAACDPETPVATPTDRLARLRRQWALCRPLVQAQRWAVEPLASVFQQAIIYYSEQRNFAHALAVECFVALHSDPIKYVAPFAQWRLKGLLLIAKTITNIGADAVEGRKEGRCHPGVVALLDQLADGALYEAILLLVLHHGPAAHSDEWPLLDTAVAMLQDVQGVSGRQDLQAALRRWVQDPSQPAAAAFFHQHLLAPVDNLASLALDVLKADLEVKAIEAK